MWANTIDRSYHLAEDCSRVAVNFRRFISGGKLHAAVHLEVDDGTDGLVDRGNETGQRLATVHLVLHGIGVQELLELLQRFLTLLISLIASSDALISPATPAAPAGLPMKIPPMAIAKPTTALMILNADSSL